VILHLNAPAILWPAKATEDVGSPVKLEGHIDIAGCRVNRRVGPFCLTTQVAL
jgi:hypothetical protein